MQVPYRHHTKAPHTHSTSHLSSPFLEGVHPHATLPFSIIPSNPIPFIFDSVPIDPPGTKNGRGKDRTFKSKIYRRFPISPGDSNIITRTRNFFGV